mgnify:CR=1 FL=1
MRERTRTMAIAVLISLSVTAAFAQNSGLGIYKAKCLMCHAEDGSGNTPAGKATKTPSFNLPEMLKVSDAEFIADTKNGKGKMPAYSGKLTDQEIKEVIAYIRTLQKR